MATLETLVCAAQCGFQHGGGSAGLFSLSSASLSSIRHRTLELHRDGVLYLFEEPVKSMAKHMRERVYVQGSRVLDVGAPLEKECLALFLGDYDYAERVDEFGNVEGHLFNPVKLTKTKPKPTVAAEEMVKGWYMVLLYMADKNTKWRVLRAVQRYSLEYPALYPVDSGDQGAGRGGSVADARGASEGGLEGGAGASSLKGLTGGGSAPRTRGMLDDKANAAANGGGSTGASCQHEGRRVNQAVSVPSAGGGSAAAALLVEEPRVRPFTGTGAVAVTAPPRSAAPAAATSSAGGGGVTGAVEDEEELLPEASSPACSSPTCSASPLGTTREGATSSGGPVEANASFPSFGDGAAARYPVRLRNSPLYSVCLEGRPDNQCCADCGDAFPTWCVLKPFGAFVCISCVGVHRQLWSNKCREAEMDAWPAADVAFMAARGNRAVNEELEWCIAFPVGHVAAALGQVAVKPKGRQAPAAQRAAYIQQKYEDRLFTKERHPEAAVGGGGGGVAMPTASDGDVSHSLNSSPQCPVSLDAAESLLPLPPSADGGGDVDNDEGPPQYCGLADVLVKELVTPGHSFPGAVCVITNGYQALHTKGGRRLLNLPTSTAWDEHLQVGVVQAGRPLYCAVYSAKTELLAAGEFYLPRPVVETGNACMVAVELPWCQLHKRSQSRREGEVWQVTMLTSFRLLL